MVAAALRELSGPQAFIARLKRALKSEGLIETRTIEQFYDPVNGMFLPDRYVRGTCPKCGTLDQYGDSCESCGATYTPADLKDAKTLLDELSVRHAHNR